MTDTITTDDGLSMFTATLVLHGIQGDSPREAACAFLRIVGAAEPKPHSTIGYRVGATLGDIEAATAWEAAATALRVLMAGGDGFPLSLDVRHIAKTVDENITFSLAEIARIVRPLRRPPGPFTVQVADDSGVKVKVTLTQAEIAADFPGIDWLHKAGDPAETPGWEALKARERAAEGTQSESTSD